MMREILAMDFKEQESFWANLKTGYAIHFFTTAEEGLSALSQNTGLVFLCLNLPDMHGMDVLTKIKSEYPSVPVIIVTFCAAVDTCTEAFRKGARDYLLKPLNAEEIISKIEILMHAAQTSRNRQHISLVTEPLEESYPDIPSHLVNGVLKVRDFIAQNSSESLTLDAACKMASLSKTYFCRIFKYITGLSLTNYIHFIKIQIAEELLRDKRLSVTDVALRLGYNDPNYFSTIYKRITGNSPRQQKTSEHCVMITREEADSM